MNFFQNLRRSRRPRRSRLPDSTTLASCSYQEAHDLACGLDPQRERKRRQAEKAALPVRHRPYTAAGRAAQGASLAQQPQAAAPAAPPVFCMDFAPAEADSPPAPLSATPQAGPPDLAALSGEEDRIPNHVLEAAAKREGEGFLDEDPYFELEEPRSAAERDEQVLLASLTSELRGAVARAAQRAREGAGHGAA
ncbi:hypothetical protein Dgeo_2968 (plasmid) [Deinococcus geothermalis DSM 11300]|uniref:Uncharacterized protein n=2 Tax=Deinococcus TaxID=1298 RepID=A8ZRA2_DEIGD|nr:hypothetical protein [Deinococcus geothermalis]ABW35011.1 hypothetical protein Dgeo_2968 [Deinococcus geothermalis DSM 11300]